MARGSQERELEFIATAKAETGHSIEEWMTILDEAGIEPKQNTLIKYIKSDHGLNHMQANLIAGIYRNDGEPVFNYEKMFAALFDGNEQWRPVYENLKAEVDTMFDDVVFIPTKSYISVEGERVFGCVKFTKKAIRYGLDLGDTPFEGRIQKAKGLGAMPNISHMIELGSAEAIDNEVLQYTQQAFDRVHG